MSMPKSLALALAVQRKIKSKSIKPTFDAELPEAPQEHYNSIAEAIMAKRDAANAPQVEESQDDDLDLMSFEEEPEQESLPQEPMSRIDSIRMKLKGNLK